MTYQIHITFSSLCSLRNLWVVAVLCWGLDVNAETYPRVGERVYSLPDSKQEVKEVAEPSKISSDQSGLSGIKDPIEGRQISQKSVYDSGELPARSGRSRSVGKASKAKGQDAQRPKVASAFVELKPMAITGRTTKPSLRFSVDERDLEPSDSVKSPKLIDRVYEDARQIK